MAWGRRTAFNATRAFAPPEATAPGADEERLRARTLKPSAPPHGGSNSRDGGILVFQYNAMAGRALTGEAGFWLAVLRGHWPSDLAQTDYFSLGSTVFSSHRQSGATRFRLRHRARRGGPPDPFAPTSPDDSLELSSRRERFRCRRRCLIVALR